ncbi:MAG: hypothetical protein H6719_15620 [Sandaracinaceae bacterium]|nr:hypothetical protein [Sandaracinaceae bacterium]
MRRLAGLLFVAALLGAPTGALAQINLMSAGGFLFDIEDATGFAPGSLSNGSVDAYDGCYMLRVGGLDYAPFGTSTMSLGGRQVDLPATPLAGLSVRRLVYVPATGGDYARYLEVLENTGASPISTTVEVYGNLGSDGSTVVTGSSSGDTVVSVADGWFSTDDTDSSGDPSLAHVFSGSSASIDPTAVSLSTDNLSYMWSVTVPAGGRVVILHFAVQANDRAASMAEARRLVETPDDALAGADDYVDDIVNFGIAVPGAPRARFTSDFEADEGDEIVVDVAVEDPEGDSFTFSWDLDDDGVFGEMPGVTTVRVAAGTTDGPDAVRLGVEAMDSRGNRSQRYRTIRVVNVEPRITSTPPLSTSVGVDLRYQIEVDDPAGALDPPTFALVRGPTRMTVSDTGMLSWIATEADVTTAGETHVVEVSVDDGDEGLGTQRWELMVSPNHAPSPPIPAYPIDSIAILDPMPRLAAQNSEDADLDPLTYTFQLDAAETFDSPELQEWTLPEMPGFTSVTLDAPLPLDRLYFWRVRSNDGTADSEWRATSFWVIYDPLLPPRDAGVDAGDLPDAGVGIDAGMGGGGGCAAGGRSTSGGPSWLGLVGLAFWWRRRSARAVTRA